MEKRERIKALRDGALLFLKAGGHLSFTEWKGLTKDEKAAFVLAGELFSERQAALIARLAGSPDETNEILGGGSVRRTEALKSAVLGTVSEIGSGG